MNLILCPTYSTDTPDQLPPNTAVLFRSMQKCHCQNQHRLWPPMGMVLCTAYMDAVPEVTKVFFILFFKLTLFNTC